MSKALPSAVKDDDLPAVPGESTPVLSVRNLSVQFTGPKPFTPVDDVTFDIKRKEILGVVGESGSGKSMTARAIMGLLPTAAQLTEGTVELSGEQLAGRPQKELRTIRGRKVSLVSQNPMTSLNPSLRVGWQLAEALRAHREISRADAWSLATEALASVGIPNAREQVRAYPHEYSGGMRQRVLLAMGVLNGPELLIADEPTTALDVTIQAQVLELIQDLQQRLSMAVLLITHDLGVIARMCDRVAVMYAGQLVELADVHTLFKEPAHPYTRALLRSVPRIDDIHQEFRPIAGRAPNLRTRFVGCRFKDRCPLRKDVCDAEQEFVSLGPRDAHMVRCCRAHE